VAELSVTALEAPSTRAAELDIVPHYQKAHRIINQSLLDQRTADYVLIFADQEAIVPTDTMSGRDRAVIAIDLTSTIMHNICCKIAFTYALETLLRSCGHR
jgi:hypothetical protein